MAVSNVIDAPPRVAKEDYFQISLDDDFEKNFGLNTNSVRINNENFSEFLSWYLKNG